MEKEEKKARLYRVNGRVQGVGYRNFAEWVARGLHLEGYVRNLRNGSVEVSVSNRRSMAIRSGEVKAPHAARASEPPMLMRRTPSSAASLTERPDAPIRRLTGLGCTAFTIADICSLVLMPGA